MAYPIWRKKQIFFNSIRSNSEEEVIELIEIGLPCIFDPNNPWKIKKIITPQVLHQGNLVISFSETFDYILSYWNLDNAKQFVNGAVYTGVSMWDVTICRKKTFSYKVNNTPLVVTRELIETDAWTFHSNNMRHTTKKITSQDLTFGELRIPFYATFDCILPYWKLELARSLVDGSRDVKTEPKHRQFAQNFKGWAQDNLNWVQSQPIQA
ncbi:hypothetical protein H5410_039059 [Solanum commersonii]|uniref:Uncharacterized protein n=1 Tax=Solanum commersonii TaxID=4109 RepID=A0A9J5YAT6_SOLCO|nr:hypothetical protein H5410_039059 [Solanum commersonii]